MSQADEAITTEGIEPRVSFRIQGNVAACHV